MPSIQANYNVQMPVAFAGMVVDMRNRTVESPISLSPNPMVFGAVALRGTTDNTVLNVGDTGAGGFKGIIILDPTVRPSNAGNQFVTNDITACMIKGEVWVTVGSSVSPGNPAYYTSGGVITATATSNTAISGATFESTAASSGLAKLRL